MTPLEHSDLSTRPYWRLKRAGITHLEQLAAWTRADLLAVYGLGAASVAEIESCLQRFGFALRPEPEAELAAVERRIEAVQGELRAALGSIEADIDGRRVRLDAVDRPHLDGATWHVRPVGRNGALRVVAYTRVQGRFHLRQLHRELVGTGRGQWVVFANDDPFDLRRANLVVLDHPANALACPFGSDELERLYVGEGLSREEVGRRAAVALGHPHPLSYECVDRWLSEAGIPLRSRSEALEVRHARGAEPFPEWQARAVEAASERRRADA